MNTFPAHHRSRLVSMINFSLWYSCMVHLFTNDYINPIIFHELFEIANFKIMLSVLNSLMKRVFIEKM